MNRMTLCAAALLVLAGCGGGGDGGTANAPAPAATNVNAAYQSFLSQKRTYNLAGSTTTGIQLTGGLYVTAPISKFSQQQGVAYDVGGLTIQVLVNQDVVAAISETLLYNVGTLNWAYEFDGGINAASNCFVPTAWSTLPTAAKPGDSGVLASGPYYSGCTSTTLTTSKAAGPTGQLALVWSYTTNGIWPAVCVSSTSTPVSGRAYSTTYCVQVVDAQGTLGSGARVSQTDATGAGLTMSGP